MLYICLGKRNATVCKCPLETPLELRGLRPGILSILSNELSSSQGLPGQPQGFHFASAQSWAQSEAIVALLRLLDPLFRLFVEESSLDFPTWLSQHSAVWTALPPLSEGMRMRVFSSDPLSSPKCCWTSKLSGCSTCPSAPVSESEGADFSSHVGLTGAAALGGSTLA